MAIQSAYTYKGLSAPTAYSKISGVKWNSSKPIQVYIDIYSVKAEYDAGNQPLETKVYALDFPIEEADVPALGPQALLDAFDGMSNELYTKLLAEADFSGGSVVA